MVRLLRLLRWVLFFEGWVLLAFPAAMEFWAAHLEAILPAGSFHPTSYLTWLSWAAWLAGALCLATFWGMGAQKPWVRVTGLAISLFNLAIFPPLGLTGIVAMRRFARYNLPEDADDHSLVEESRVVRIFRVTATLILLIIGYRWIDSFTAHLGVGGPEFGWRTVLLILAGQMVVAFAHDLGHCLAALAFGFRFPVFRLGPWTWTATAGSSRALSTNLGRFFAHDSYLAGFPTDAAHVRTDLIAITAAGPVASALTGLGLFLGVLSSPGTAVAGEAQFLGILALLFALDFSMQMLPFGYTDGRILVDLISFNRRGRNMVLQMTAAAGPDGMTQSLGNLAAVASGQVADPVHVLRENLNQLLRRGVVGGPELALAYQSLAAGEVLTGRFDSAREHLERSLDLYIASPNPARLGANWQWAEKLHRAQQRPVESHYAYGRAVQYWEAAKGAAPKMANLVEARVALAMLHMSQGELGACIEELEGAEMHVPQENANPMLAGKFHHAYAVCGFRLRWADRARKHAFTAARAYLHKSLEGQARGLGLLALGDLATELWQAGQSNLAADLLAQAASGFAPGDAATWLRLMRAEILAKTGCRAEAMAVLDEIPDADPVQEMRIASILGWAALMGGRYLDAAEYFAAAAATLDERERARAEAGQARALFHAGRRKQAVDLAKSACNVLMREEHGDAGLCLLLLTADEYRGDPHLSGHPFFEEGCRIVRAARFFPPPDKCIGLRDALAHFEDLRRPIECAAIQEELQRAETQMTWDGGAVARPDGVI